MTASYSGSKTRQKLNVFGIFNELLSTQNVNVARLFDAIFSVIFKHRAKQVKLPCNQDDFLCQPSFCEFCGILDK